MKALLSSLVLTFFFGNLANAQIRPELGRAGSFGLLSGGNVTDNNPINVRGYEGAFGSFSGTYAPPSDSSFTGVHPFVLQGLADLKVAKQVISQIPGANTGGTTIGSSFSTPGHRKYGGNLKADSAQNISFSGDQEAIFIFTIPGNLTVNKEVTISLSGGVKASNIYWNVGGTVEIKDDAEFVGIIMSSGSATIASGTSGVKSILSESNITVASSADITSYLIASDLGNPLSIGPVPCIETCGNVGLTNQGFESENIAINSSLTFTSDCSGLSPGRYTFTTQAFKSGGSGCHSDWMPTEGHTDPGTGKFMVVDLPSTNGANPILWRQNNISVTAGDAYQFGVWLTNLVFNDIPSKDPKIQLFVVEGGNERPIGDLFSVPYTNETEGRWHLLCADFTPVSNSISVIIKGLVQGVTDPLNPIGDDVGLDDVFLSQPKGNVALSQSQGTCGPILTATVTSPGIPVDFTWHGPNTTVSTGNTNTYVPTENGTHYVVVTMSNGCVLTSNELIVVGVDDGYDLNKESGQDVYCTNETFNTVLAVTPDDGDQYNWYLDTDNEGPAPPVLLTDNNHQDPEKLTVNNASGCGTYHVEVIRSSGCTSITNSYKITCYAAPVADAGEDKFWCYEQTTSLIIGGDPTGSGGTTQTHTFDWTGNNLSEADVANPTVTAAPCNSPPCSVDYVVTVSQNNSGKTCSSTDEMTIEVVSPPDATVSADPPYRRACINSDNELRRVILLSVNEASTHVTEWTYQWFKDGDEIPGAKGSSYTVTESGIYGVLVTDINTGCTTFIGGLQCTFGGPTANAGEDKVICRGESVAIGGNPTASGGTSPYTYRWSPDEDIDDTEVANPNVNPEASKTYTIRVTDADECWDEDEVTVTVNQLPVAEAGVDRSICSGTSTTLGIPEGAPNNDYEWTTEGNSTVIGTSSEITVSPTTTTIYVLTVTDSETDCESEDKVTVTVNESPDPTFTVDHLLPICPGSTIQFTSNEQNPSAKHQWHFTNTFPTSSNNADPAVTYTGPGQIVATHVVVLEPCTAEVNSEPIADETDYRSEPCCEELITYDEEHVILENTSVTWTPSNNPFGNSTGGSIRTGISLVNSTLTIEGLTVEFGPEANIGVDMNSTLNLENTTLDAIPCEFVMWQGVTLVFVSEIAPPTLSRPQINMDNSKIKNARTGIHASEAGGIIIAENGSEFINNHIGVNIEALLGGPTGWENGSRFTDCNFITEFGGVRDKFTYNSQGKHMAHVRLYGVQDIRFTNCDFLGFAPRYVSRSLPELTPFNKGIFSQDANYDLEGINNFEMLDWGIDHGNSVNVVKGLKVQNATFTGNVTGVHFYAGRNQTIVNNDFTASGSILDNSAYYGTGVMNNGGINTKVVNGNSFDGVQYGVWAWNMGPEGTSPAVHFNEFQDVEIGVLAAADNSQLGWTCNDYSGLSRAALSQAGRFKSQGSPSCLNSAALAGNRFFQSNTVTDIEVRGPQSPWEYVHHNDNGTGIFKPTVNPLGFGIVKITECLGWGVRNCANIPVESSKSLLEELLDLIFPGGSALNLGSRDPHLVMNDMLYALDMEGKSDWAYQFLDTLSWSEKNTYLIPEYLRRSEFAKAQFAINQLPIQSEEDLVTRTYFQHLINILASKRSITNLTLADSLFFEEIARSNSLTSHSAQSILHFNYGRNFRPDLGGLEIPVRTEVLSGISGDKATKLKWNLSPNPSTRIIDLVFETEFDHNGIITVYDNLGKAIKTLDTETDRKNVRLDLSGFPNGVYYLVFNNQGSFFHEKFVINKE